ncbi:lasso peptide biosynthesis PqqD family chaperone [Intestinibacter sp.]|uniref:lasso peptide biosynthesis PqqD family chaperone n=1 Tax=Intestinibacter sp. TaxID=1965304 RepID=UPI002A9125E8|nr:lasso peptide biosynthesis PqqD family chaperone [Intestinibacter sp.]MDY5213366.1 lasso peptide biosynthesis PqqD family chaperone [Intestinibacter sp.]
MLDFKKFSGKVGQARKDYGVNIDSVITKNTEIDDTDLDGEKVMMNLDKGQYFMMNEVGSRIWELIEGNTPIVNIIAALTNEYDVDEETCENTVMEFLGRLKNADLIKVV